MKKPRRTTQTKTPPVLTNDQLTKVNGGMFNPQPDPPGDAHG